MAEPIAADLNADPSADPSANGGASRSGGGQRATPEERLHHELHRLEAALPALERMLLRPLQEDAPPTLAGRLRAIDGQVRQLQAMIPQIAASVGASQDRARLPLTLMRLRQITTLWPALHRRIAEQAAPEPRALLPPPAAPRTAEASAAAASDSLFKALHAVLKPVAQSRTAEAHGCFADIPLPHGAFVTYMQAARRVLLALRLQGGAAGGTEWGGAAGGTAGRGGVAAGTEGRRAAPGGTAEEGRFLDVGCGSGLTLLAAAPFFGSATGIEYDAGYVRAARRTLRRAGSSARVIGGDALSFGGYGGFDVIYFYRPMRDDAKLIALERRIAGAARPGTILIAPYESFPARARDLGCIPLQHPLHVTGLDEAAVQGLRAAAERAGPALPAPPLPLAGLPSPWSRIDALLRARGV